ncbi:glycoside hydrolase family protein [Bacillaceae bacterium C204]|uniref:glycoside hydrolase family protein n=1 Tax=Neobacillus sp. 204 TaxID=3383351 RepID=UPI00397E756D
MQSNLFSRMLPAPKNGGFRLKDYWVWCGSVVKGEDGRFHMFASRWPKSLPMHPGWLIASEVVRAVADLPEGPYEFQEVVFPARGAEYWDGRTTHNPHITKHADTYILYYMGSTHPFPDVAPDEELALHDPRVIVGRANKRVGIATSKSVFGPWKRLDEPLLLPRPGKYDSYFTSNPAPCVHEDGSVLLIYKSRSYQGYKHSYHMSLGVAWAPHYLEEYSRFGPIFSSDKIHLEDPFIWKTKDGYELIAKDMEGNICHEEHGGIHAFSKDGVDWTVFENPKAYSRKVLWDDGSVQTMGSFERPFLLFQDGQPTHLFAATADGPGGFEKATETWNMVIPLKAD